MNIVLEAKRLLIRPFTALDAKLIYESNRDPDDTRYTHDPVKDPAHASEILRKLLYPNMLFIIMVGGPCM